MLTNIAKGLFARLVAYGVFAAGFWFIYMALLHGANLRGAGSGALGGVLILLGLYLIVKCRRSFGAQPALPDPDENKEQDPGDSVAGSR